MKKIMLGLLLLVGISATSMAQTPVYSSSGPVYTTTADPVYVSPTLNSNTTLVVPVYSERMFRMNYPAANRTAWYRVSDDWWRVSYMDNGPWYTLGYNTRGESYPISLPVTQNKVPSEVVDAVLARFNSSVYDITETIGSNLMTQYIVRTLDTDGQVKSWRVNEHAVDVTQ